MKCETPGYEWKPRTANPKRCPNQQCQRPLAIHMPEPIEYSINDELHTFGSTRFPEGLYIGYCNAEDWGEFQTPIPFNKLVLRYNMQLLMETNSPARAARHWGARMGLPLRGSRLWPHRAGQDGV